MIRDPAYAAEIEVKNTCRAAGGGGGGGGGGGVSLEE